jgi:PAS domain S-box-containing protein
MCPLIVGNRVEGSLTFLTAQALEERQRRTCEAFARQVALTLENTSLLTALHEQMARLRESEERLRVALSAAAMALWQWDVPANRVLYSDTAGPVFGLTPGQRHETHEEFLATVYPEDRDYVARTLQQALDECGAYHVEYRVLWPGGGVHWVEHAGEVHCDAAGQPLRLISIATEITERKDAEETLRQARQAEGRLEGIILAAREVGHLLNNDLQLAVGRLDLLQDEPNLPNPVRAEMIAVLDALAEAARHVQQFQQVVRVETKDTARDLHSTWSAPPAAPPSILPERTPRALAGKVRLRVACEARAAAIPCRPGARDTHPESFNNDPPLPPCGGLADANPGHPPRCQHSARSTRNRAASRDLTTADNGVMMAAMKALIDHG